MKRAIVVVLDGVGAGAAPDAEAFGDPGGPSTLRHVWDRVGGFDAPNLAACGLLQAGGIEPRTTGTLPAGLGAAWGRLRPLSQGGKDSVTGHWEMMGVVLDRRFPTYPDGFPIPLLKAFERAIGVQTLGNQAASGTEIIARLGDLHVQTGFPIVYTSADSVFQIACHEEVVPVETLYAFCREARALCAAPNDVQRVIARPFAGDAKAGFRRTERRQDFPVPPPSNLVDRIGDVYGIGVVPQLFGGRGFRPVARSQNNREHRVELDRALATDARFVFANFEDFDMLYGHRNDPEGFARCLVEFDATLGDLLGKLGPDDLLLLTADHGNDPTDASTDHSREYAPLCAIGRAVRSGPMGDRDGFATVGEWVARHVGLAAPLTGPY